MSTETTPLAGLIPADTPPTETLDYCSQNCQSVMRPGVDPFPITPWIENAEGNAVCACCGGEWGGDNEGTCRGLHIEGEVWWLLMDAEQDDPDAVEKLRTDYSIAFTRA